MTCILSCQDYEPAVKTSNSGLNFSASEIADQRGYTIFNDAVAHSGIEAELNPADSVTMLVPTNDAFAAFLEDLGVASITEVDAATVANVLRYHVINGAISSSELAESNATLLSGKNVHLSAAEGGGVGFNGKASVVSADLFTSDGIIHGISSVLEAPSDDIMTILRASDDHSNLVTELERTGLDASLEGTTELTLMAPNNAAIAAAGVAGMSVEDATEALSFHVFPGRVHSVEFADGRLATILGSTSEDNVQEVEVDGLEFNGAAVDSANYSADNGIVHFIDNVIAQDSENSDNIPADFQALIDALGASVQAEYANLDTTYSFMALDAGAPAPGTFATDSAMHAWLDTYTWDGSVDISELASGTKITTGSAARGSEFSFYVESLSSADSVRINNEAIVDGEGGETSYNGQYNRIVGALPTPLPEEKISDQLEANGYTFIAKAIEVTGKTSQVDAEGTTFYAISNAVFTDTTGYDAITDQLDTLSTEDSDDADVIAALSALIDAHTVPSTVASSFIVTNDLPIQTSAVADADGDIIWGNIAMNVVIITDTQNPNTSTVGLNAVDIWAANGVIHELEEVIVEVDLD